MNIRVKKRNGRLEEFNVEKIHQVVDWACKGINGVSFSDIEMNAELALHDKIPSTEIHDILIDSANDRTIILKYSDNIDIQFSELLKFLKLPK